MRNRYTSINAWLKGRFGERVSKVSLASGCSCPNLDGTVGTEGCTFCNLRGYYPATSPDVGNAGKPLKAQLEEGLAYATKRHGTRKAIAYFQSGSNTHAKAGLLEPLFEEAANHPAVVGLAISTRPDCIGEEHLDLFRKLAGRATLWIELGLQSAHDETLARTQRGHSVGCFEEACRRLREVSLPVCAHIILGLPGEDVSMMIETARFLNRVGVWGVKIHNLHVLRGTRLEEDFRRGNLALPSRETYAGWVADVLEELDPQIVIHRVSGHSPRHLTVAPAWSINKLAVLGAVEGELARRDSWQGKQQTRDARHETRD